MTKQVKFDVAVAVFHFSKRSKERVRGDSKMGSSLEQR